MGEMALSRPFAYAASRTFATRLLHSLLRGVSQDRLDLLGEEYFQYVLKPQLRRESAEKLITAVRNGEEIVLVSQLLEHVVRPMAHHFGISSFVSNRLEFRDGYATGRLAIAKLQAIRDKRRDTKVMSHGPDHVLEELAYQHDLFAVT